MNIWTNSRNLVFAAAAAMGFVAAPAHAATITFAGTGVVEAVAPIATPATGTVVVGDQLAFNFTFDTALGVRTVDSGAAQQTFVFPIGAPAISVGDFAFTPGSASGIGVGVSLGRGFRLFPGDQSSSPILNQQFLIPGLATGNVPFDAGPGGRFALLLTSAFRDPNVSAVPTIADIRDPGGAVANRFQLVAINGSNRVVGFIDGSFAGSFAAVPEPSAWLMMIVGFGATGWAARRRKAFAGQLAQA